MSINLSKSSISDKYGILVLQLYQPWPVQGLHHENFNVR